MHRTDPHRHCTLHYACAPLSQARLVVVAAHGRYGVAGDILKLARDVDISDVAWIAPQAEGRSWWQGSFLAPLTENEPRITSALFRMSAIFDDLAEQGFGPDRIVLTGFSQGACLMLEHVARNPAAWRGVVAMSGGLLGSADTDEPPSNALLGHIPKRFDYHGTLEGVPIMMGCHCHDPVIPLVRVQDSAAVLGRMGASVTVEIRPGKMHGVLDSDIAAIRALLTE